jgi:hypothetical protein
MAVFSRAHASGSLEYWGSCDIGERPDFPTLKADLLSRGSTIETLRELFSDDPPMRVNKDAAGLIRMVELQVPRDLLEVKIKRVSFRAGAERPWELKNALIGGSDGLYDPQDALRHLLSTPEVVDFRRAHDIGPLDFEQVTGSHEEVSPHSPHISGELTDVTLSQALDHILDKFPGIWIYENCPSKRNAREVFFQFYQNTPVWEVLKKHNASHH